MNSELLNKYYAIPYLNDSQEMLGRAMYDLSYNYPDGVTTWGSCNNPDCDGSSRGSNLCSKCVVECITEITGDESAALGLCSALEAVRDARVKLRELVK